MGSMSLFGQIKLTKTRNKRKTLITKKDAMYWIRIKLFAQTSTLKGSWLFHFTSPLFGIFEPVL